MYKIVLEIYLFQQKQKSSHIYLITVFHETLSDRTVFFNLRSLQFDLNLTHLEITQIFIENFVKIAVSRLF